MALATCAAHVACVYTARWKGGMALAQRALPVYTQRDGREEWHLRSARCLCIHSAMKGRNDTCAAHAACVYTARWKGGMTLAQRTLPVYTQRDGREGWHLRSARCLCIHSAMKGKNDTCAAHAACVYTARWKGGMTLAQRTLPVYTQRDGREEWHLRSARCLCIHSAMKGKNDTCAARAAYVNRARWKGGMTGAERTLPVYTQRDGREE